MQDAQRSTRPQPPVALPVALLESAINHTLSLDQEIANRLVSLQGKVISIELTRPHTRFFIAPMDGYVQVLADHAAADASIKGTLPAMLKMASGETGDGLFGQGVELGGETGVVVRFAEILKQLDIDSQELLSEHLNQRLGSVLGGSLGRDLLGHQVGDVVAGLIGKAGKGVGEWLTEIARRTPTNTAEYLQYEAEMILSRGRFEAFIDDIGELRNDQARADARLKRIEQTLNGRSGDETDTP